MRSSPWDPLFFCWLTAWWFLSWGSVRRAVMVGGWQVLAASISFHSEQLAQPGARWFTWGAGWVGRMVAGPSHGRDPVYVHVPPARDPAAPFLSCLTGKGPAGSIMPAPSGGHGWGRPPGKPAQPAALPLSPQALVFAKEGRVSPGVWLQSRIIRARRAGTASSARGVVAGAPGSSGSQPRSPRCPRMQRPSQCGCTPGPRGLWRVELSLPRLWPVGYVASSLETKQAQH